GRRDGRIVAPPDAEPGPARCTSVHLAGPGSSCHHRRTATGAQRAPRASFAPPAPPAPFPVPTHRFVSAAPVAITDPPAPSRRTRSLLVAGYTLVLFLNAALLFTVQPMFSKMALPLLGGAPAVWNTCMLVFQALLL